MKSIQESDILFPDRKISIVRFVSDLKRLRQMPGTHRLSLLRDLVERNGGVSAGRTGASEGLETEREVTNDARYKTL